MSVRIYQLSKEIEMDNADLIALLKERGYEVKSASSTVDNISADSLREEFGPKPEAETKPEETPAPVEEKAPVLPQGAIVRSKEDIERERREREEEEQRKRAEVNPPRPATPPPPVGKAPPPLPKGPVIKRRVVTPGTPATPAAGTQGPPKVPVLRTDLPKEEPKQETAPEPVAEAKPESPAPKGPPPIKPPVLSAPKPIAPPSVAPPAAKAPSSTEAPEETPSEEEGAVAATEAASDLQPLQVRTPIVVRDFAHQIGRKPFQLISELMEMSIFASMNSTIEEDVAERLAKTHGFALEVRHRGEGIPSEQVKEKKPEKSKGELLPRPPVVCILGHVDHGKTTLLDTIRKANVVSTEAGGITQHIGAYQISHKDNLISFIDTPGHAAFSNMRARGARTTDIAILVVAADDGFMPQTDEALGHARVAKVPIVVAINKTDAPGANIDRVMRQMQERELAPEEWGGETLCAQVSALKGEGIEDLLDVILLQAEVTETIVADPKAPVEGVVLEAQKELGRGSTASVIVQQGTLKPGTALTCGEHYCRVRQLVDDQGKQIKSAGPSKPVKVIGWSSPPDAGDVFTAVKNEREAKKLAEANELARRKLEAADRKDAGTSVDDLFAAIEKTQKKSFAVLVKADVYGTAEALATALQAIKSDKIDLEVVDMGVGDITRNDVIMSSAAGSSIVGFNVGLENGVGNIAKHHGIHLFQHNIIYELIDQVKDAMADLLEPELRENKIGAAEVRQVFPLGRGQVAGCMVTEGRVQRDALARLMRNGNMVHESTISTLKRFKEDASEVRAGYECGIQLDGYNDYREKDTIEVFEILKIKPSL
jgi:translation initiation factor IF-2